MKLKPQTLDRLKQILEPELHKAIGSSILRAGDQYVLYGAWSIETIDPNTVQVRKHGEIVGTFFNLKNAVSWCVAERYNRIRLAFEIQNLDSELSRLSNDVTMSQSLLKRARDPDIRMVVRIKMEHNHSKLNNIQYQLEKCVKRAKYCQLQGFNDEIARTRRPAPIRTNR